MLLEKTRCKNLGNLHYAQFIQKYWHERLLSPSAQAVWNQSPQFPQTTQKTATGIHIWGFSGTGQPTEDATVTALTL